MKPTGQLILLAAILAGGIWLWTIFFPAPEKIIRDHLTEIARDVSFDPNESPLAAFGKAQKLAGFFNTNVEVNLDWPDHSQNAVVSRGEIAQDVAGARAEIRSLRITFLDVNVTVSADKKSATADLTAQAQTPGKGDFVTQEMKFTFKKIGGDWLVTRVETVRTLSKIIPKPPGFELNRRLA